MLEDDLEKNAGLLPPSTLNHEFAHVPRYMSVRKGVKNTAGQTLPGWSVIVDADKAVLGWNFKTRREAVAFAAGCEAGRAYMASMF
jgi:hypothetical protein